MSITGCLASKNNVNYWMPGIQKYAGIQKYIRKEDVRRFESGRVLQDVIAIIEKFY